MTRGGKKKHLDEMGDDEAGAAVDTGLKKGGSPEDKLDELAGLVKSLIQSQAARDQQIENESARQEQRWRSMQHQFRQIQLQVNEMRDEQQQDQDNFGMDNDRQSDRGEPDEGPSMVSQQAGVLPRREPLTHRDPKLLPLTSEDDIEHFLTTFERMAQVCRWPREEWAVRLVPLLTGKARSAYVFMDIADSEVYDKVKDAILVKYEITADTYRRRFRSLDIHQNETPRELYVRLKDLFHKWVKPEKSTVKDISELIILEQFLRMVNPDLEVWIRERAPKSAEEAASLAEVFMSARTGTRRTTFGRDGFLTRRSKSDGGERGGGIAQSRNQPSTRQFTTSKFNPTKKLYSGTKSDVRCYQCNQIGHTQYTCPATTQSKPSLLCSVPRPTFSASVHEPVRTAPVLVNGQREVALLDTGSFQSVVLSSLVPRELWSDARAKISCVHGDEKDYPMAEVYLTVGGQTFLLPVALAPKLPYAVILGLDVPTLLDLVHNGEAKNLNFANDLQETESPEVDSFGQASDRQANLGPLLPVCNLVTTRAQKARNPLKELPFFDVELEAGSVKPTKSRAQRRRDKFLGSARPEVEQHMKPAQFLEFDVPSDISALQQTDPTLKPWFDKVSEVEGKKQGRTDVLAEATYAVRDGILYQCKGKTEAIALPQAFRQKVMELGHSIPWAGHLAFQKSLNRIARRFVWPGMYTQVQQFCASCQTCQLTSNKGVARAQLQPLPIIDTPFERIGMDIVGPLERSSSGNRYILVICDYATRYPEAFPLRSIKARHVANCLLQLFSRVGIAKEVLTDCGTNFLSKLLREVYQLLGIKGIKTTPYHPQSDGLVERFNQTLKNMLRKFISETGADWDQWLPYLLFAYREVPQASTGFSPFELLYGRQVRGPLDLLKELWENPAATGENVAAYVVKMRERLEQMTVLAQENMRTAQNNQKTWYDKKARERVFEPGQQVLLLLPNSDSKLLAKWQGPYQVTKRLGKVTYELHMPDRKKKHQTFHVNLLKEFLVPPQQPVPQPALQSVKQQFLVRVVKDEEEGEQFFPTNTEPGSVALSHLQHSQQEDIRPLLDPKLFQEKPGFTTLVQHKVHLRENAPPRRKFYRIPERLVPQLKKEIELMLELGIIETSTSEWCSPIVLVPKKDGSLRFCIDFRYLNAISKFDPYPMPRIDELLERVGRGKFITTLDLSKGYWQLALAPEAKELTAFKTPFGVFQFKVMPFGLQGAPATFQRLMDQVLKDVSEFAAAYLDDVVIFSQTWEEHVAHLQHVLQLIKSAGLTINPHKCMLAQRQVEYLGYVVGHGVVKPQMGKVEAIHAYPVPTTKRKVRAFVGLVGWYSKFIPHFADRAAALTDLTKASAPNKVKWTEDCNRAFNDLKAAITSDSVLHSPDFTQPFTLQTDASGVGIGAVLLQEVDGETHPVVFLSRKLQDRETRYSTVEKECLAMKWAVESLRYYLLGRHFVLETDHRALQWLHRMKDSNMRIARWYLSLQPYDFTVQYRAGKSNMVADCLSRMYED